MLLPTAASFAPSVKPLESLIFVSQVGIHGSNLVRRRVAGLALRLPGFNAFGESALPAR